MVTFIGAVTEQPNLCLITEFMQRGSMHDLLHRGGLRPDPAWLLRIALDVAQGAHYLHSCTPPIIHRDLKSQNILVDQRWTAKIADFGLSRFFQVREAGARARERAAAASRALKRCSRTAAKARAARAPAARAFALRPARPASLRRSHRRARLPRAVPSAGGVQVDIATMTGQIGTPGWTAPEVFKTNCYDHKVDVYSYAVLLAECASGDKPFHGMDAMQIAFATVYRNKRPDLPAALAPGVSKLIKTCWDADPVKRPSFAAIVDQLRKLRRADRQPARRSAAVGPAATGGSRGPTPTGGRRPARVPSADASRSQRRARAPMPAQRSAKDLHAVARPDEAQPDELRRATSALRSRRAPGVAGAGEPRHASPSVLGPSTRNASPAAGQTSNATLIAQKRARSARDGGRQPPPRAISSNGRRSSRPDVGARTSTPENGGV